ncbi:hypothetical protein CEP52_005576 [Fusarium oligoseptatum]|uniref:Monooxygenase n=1 Tax=Fusarium oligoseptatum TaxID=2604345 RepID=A0A428TXG4_9HYPO|nr:hypothetical protein CEP52_005576 [Fusarium oligoseptatum]
MTQNPVFDWSDEAIRPPNADTTIGWAGVPLSQTLGYYGHIKRAVLPTNDQLGFDPDYQSISVDDIARAFVAHFTKVIEDQDVDAVIDCIYKDGYWKDVELLTWDIRTLHGPEIKPMLKERLPKTNITNVRLNDDAPPTLEVLGDDLTFILLHLDLDFSHGTGVAVVRLSPLAAKTGSATELADSQSWKIYTIGTALDTVEGWDAEHGDKMRHQAVKHQDPLGKARDYDQLRQAEIDLEDGGDPTVVIVGAGQTGLAMAARLKVLGIPHLIIEKEDRPGYSWASRYASLSLHGPTFTNHLPCVPFPHWFPVFLPAQQLAKFLRHYADIMDLNIWTNCHLDGHNAKYDEEQGKWTISIFIIGYPDFNYNKEHISNTS